MPTTELKLLALFFDSDGTFYIDRCQCRGSIQEHERSISECCEVFDSVKRLLVPMLVRSPWSRLFPNSGFVPRRPSLLGGGSPRLLPGRLGLEAAASGISAKDSLYRRISQPRTHSEDAREGLAQRTCMMMAQKQSDLQRGLDRRMHERDSDGSSKRNQKEDLGTCGPARRTCAKDSRLQALLDMQRHAIARPELETFLSTSDIVPSLATFKFIAGITSQTLLGTPGAATTL